MRFSLFYELTLPIELAAQGKTEYDVFWEAIEQCKYAEEMGFDGVWIVEHHFLENLSRSSAPEIFLAAVAQHTSKMRIGRGVVLMPPKFTPPWKVAESIATLDIISKGRVNFGCGRSVTTEELEGFGIDPSESREMMQEAMRVVPQMWKNHEFPGYKGKYMDLPKRVVVPKPIQKPHPPMWMACGSGSSFAQAGKMGVGCLSFATSPPAQQAELIKQYREAIKDPDPAGLFVNENVAAFTTLYCDTDNQAAREWAGPNSVTHYGTIARYFGDITSKPGYTEYGAAIHERERAAQQDPQVLAEEMLADNRLCVGDPDACERVIRAYEAIGVDEFMGLIQFNEITHEQSMRTIKLMGEEVIPRFRKK